jgi:hypothetical protein
MVYCVRSCRLHRDSERRRRCYGTHLNEITARTPGGEIFQVRHVILLEIEKDFAFKVLGRILLRVVNHFAGLTSKKLATAELR